MGQNGGVATDLQKRTRWEDATRTPLVVLGVLFIVAYSADVLVPRQTPLLNAAWFVLLVLGWIAFAADYIVRLSLTPRGQRGSFVTHNVIDLLSVFIPVVRALRVVNLLRGIPFFRKHSGNAVRAEIITFALVYALLYIYFIALATLAVERGAPHATITNFGDAVWWACTTVFTVGYGDTYPVTVAGRVYAVALMLGGVAIVGTASALIFSYITERIARLQHRREHPDDDVPRSGTTGE